MRWRWPWSRPEPRHAAWHPPQRIPDGDTVLSPGQRRWADLIRQASAELGPALDDRSWLHERTQPLPVHRPLLTRGQAWRSRRRPR